MNKKYTVFVDESCVTKFFVQVVDNQMVEIASSDAFFKASEVQGFFSDGSQVFFDSSDLEFVPRSDGTTVLTIYDDRSDDDDDDKNKSTTLGDERAEQIRLYLTPPSRDWRRNQTYSWKLSSAWMSNNNHDTDSDKWLFWNVENNVDSKLVMEKTTTTTTTTTTPSFLLACDSLIVHFWKSTARKRQKQLPSTKLIVKDLVLGANLQNVGDDAEISFADLPQIRPCPNSDVCDIIDGKLTPESMIESAPSSFLWRLSDKNGAFRADDGSLLVPLGLLLPLSLLVFSVCYLCCCSRIIRLFCGKESEHDYNEVKVEELDEADDSEEDE